MSGSYTPTGPWTNGGAPGISAAFLGNIENWITQVDNTTSVSVSGSVSGTATLYQFLQGVVKGAIVVLSNYKSSGSQTLALPVAFSTTSYWWTTDFQSGKIEALLSGSAQTFSVITALALGGGTESPQTFLESFSQGQCRSGFDTVRITSTSGGAGGLTVIFGV